MRYFFIALLISGASAYQLNAQNVVTKQEFDSLKAEVFGINQQLSEVKLNLAKSEKKLKAGMLISTIGYSVVIFGGQMLGGKNNDLGEVLLYTGGVIGVGGTFMLFQGFRLISQKDAKLE